MKILQIAPFYHPVLGGAEIHLKELSEGLVALGHQVTIVTTNIANMWDLKANKVGGLPPKETINGVTVVRLPPEGAVSGPILRGLVEMKGGYRALSHFLTPDGSNFLLDPPRMLAAIPRIMRAGADIVTSTGWFYPTCYHAYLARCFKRFTLVGMPLFHTAAPWPHRPIYRRLLSQCDAVIANTAHEGDFITQHGGRRVEVCGVGIHPEAYVSRDERTIRMRYGLGTAPVVGFVGRQHATKGADVLIQAMKVIWKWDQNVYLILAGSCPKRPDDLDALLQGFSTSERRHIIRIEHFPEDEKPALYSAFDVLALPSTDESFGIAYLEAWMCKRPVIGSRIGSTQCVIEDGVDGWLVNHRDPCELGEKIIEVLSNQEQRISMGSEGYAKTLASFTWPKVVERVERLFLDLNSGKALQKQSLTVTPARNAPCNR